MSLRRITSLAISVFLFASIAGIAESKTSAKAPKEQSKKWANVDGFRSAKFGMDEKRVMRAIAKDFKISSSKVKRAIHPTERTTILEITVPKLMQAGGTAKVAYVLGQKSKKLMMVNIVWGLGVTKNVNPEEVVAAANLLRSHFIKKRYEKDLLTANARITDNLLIVFRGTDKKGRMILMTLTTTTPKEGEDKVEASKKMALRLSYKLDPTSPDIFTIKEGEF